MKKVLLFLIIEIVVSLIAAFLFNKGINDGYLTTLGLMNLILGVLGLFAGVILSMARSEDAKPVLISACLLLLMGFLTCSVFPISLR
jgi:hypothetical protein